jgi:hypothetical protein
MDNKKKHPTTIATGAPPLPPSNPFMDAVHALPKPNGTGVGGPAYAGLIQQIIKAGQEPQNNTIAFKKQAMEAYLAMNTSSGNALAKTKANEIAKMASQFAQG